MVINVSKVDANPLGSESLPTPQSFASNLPVPDNESFPKVTTCNTGILGNKISNPANEESLKLAPVLSNTCPENSPFAITTNDNLPYLDARSFPKIPKCDTNRPLNKKIKSTNEKCPKPSHILGNGTGPEYLPNVNYQVVKQRAQRSVLHR
ncbi:hypothetical protein DSO57_1027128 [Entomophthora muscae]|uniref:Uncharacterized protein n=1 Tax=Entomophthora muscae TaxID=34485 RepID=A0ACC2UMN1_9FUNG|nr:hypothetical protein DSO57_1027128 [Entomophthora muscae]